MGELRDGLKLYGDFCMRVYDVAPDGTRTLRFRFARKNQITNDGRLTVLSLLAQDPAGTPVQINPEYGQIWSISIGDGGSIPPAASQVGLTSEVWTAALSTAERVYNPGTFQLNIQKTVGTTDAVGSTFSEAGLFTRGSLALPITTWQAIPERKMYARQIFPSFAKTNVMSVVFDWTLGMTVA